jgi:hypothetical protein
VNARRCCRICTILMRRSKAVRHKFQRIIEREEVGNVRSC